MSKKELTIEDLQKSILELSDKINQLENDKKSISDDLQREKENVEKINKENDELKLHNQKLFLRASANFNNPTQKEEKDEEQREILKDFKGVLNEDEINILFKLIGDEE